MANQDVIINNNVFKKNYPMVLAQNRNLAIINPVRLAYDALGYVAGQVLARNTVSGMYQKYDDMASSGLNTARCVLFFEKGVSDFQPQSAGGSTMAQAIFGGVVYKDKLTGLDANGEADLSAKTIIDATGITTMKF